MSYNGLAVPLDRGTWSCELVPAAGYRSPSGVPMRFISGDELKLLEDDSRTFTRCFRPRYDFRQTVTTDIDAIRSFMRDHLNVAHWNQPTDNAGIEHILKQAVADGRLVPVIDRDRRIPVRTGQVSHAPQHWGETYRTGGGGAASSPRPKTFHQSVMESMGLDADGATAYIVKYNAMVERIDAVLAKNAARRAAIAAAGSDGLPGVVEAVAGAVFGDNDSDSSDDADDICPATSQATLRRCSVVRRHSTINPICRMTVPLILPKLRTKAIPVRGTRTPGVARCACMAMMVSRSSISTLTMTTDKGSIMPTIGTTECADQVFPFLRYEELIWPLVHTPIFEKFQNFPAFTTHS